MKKKFVRKSRDARLSVKRDRPAKEKKEEYDAENRKVGLIMCS